MAKSRRCVAERSSIGSNTLERKRGFHEFNDNDHEVCSKIIKREVPAEPLICCAWSGNFDVEFYESIYPRRIYAVNAFLSSKACERVHDAIASFGQVLNFQMVSAADVWPREFRQSGPTIGLYFFPPLPLHEKGYDVLVYEMRVGELAMRTFLPDSELLIFTSHALPTEFQKFQGKYFLWGVFRSKKP